MTRIMPLAAGGRRQGTRGAAALQNGGLRSGNPMKPVCHLRRRLIAGAAALVALPRRALAAPTPAEVWKSPTCGCCKDWITHLEGHGFAVKVHDDGNTQAREQLRMPARLGSCHTARIGDYAIEGHVPASDIRRLLAEKPKAVGLAVPGMPIGAPGMDGPAYEGRHTPYDVLLVLDDGSTKVWRRYAA